MPFSQSGSTVTNTVPYSIRSPTNTSQLIKVFSTEESYEHSNPPDRAESVYCAETSGTARESRTVNVPIQSTVTFEYKK